MKGREGFLLSAKSAGEILRDSVREGEVVRCISHLDTDGIAAAGLLLNFFIKEKGKVHLTVVKRLSPQLIQDLSREGYSLYVFADLGSGQLNLIRRRMSNRRIVILDHHPPEGASEGNMLQVNPHLHGIDGAIEISGSGVVYFATRDVFKGSDEPEWMAIVGALGDRQDKGKNRSLIGLNAEIVQAGLKKGVIRREIDLNLFGRYSRPIHKSLEYTFDPFIPGVSGDEVGAVSLLRGLGIEVRGEDGGWRRLVDLSEEEKKKLTEELIRRIAVGKTSSRPIDIIAIHYVSEKSIGLFGDAREFCTVLNACGRLGKPDIGVLLCMDVHGDVREIAERLLSQYRRELSQYVNGILEQASSYVEKRGFLTVIKPEAGIRETMISPVTSILSSYLNLDFGVLVGVAETEDGGMYKISARVKDHLSGKIDLGKAMRAGVANESEMGGGHANAAGAEILKERLEEFLKMVEDNIEKQLQGVGGVD